VSESVRVVDGFELPAGLRAILRPGEILEDVEGRVHRLPRFFYEVPSHEAALRTRLSPHFGLNELLLVDVKEARPLLGFPRYVPFAASVLALYLERFREAAGAPVFIAYNGGYRSPTHKLSVGASPHMWGTAADLYRVGTTVLNAQEPIEQYGRLARDVAPDLFVMPYGHDLGTTDDHLHVDLGYLVRVPRECSETPEAARSD
jgi:hypothetical protein